MVKLVYTLASGASPRKWVGVQVPLRAQKIIFNVKLLAGSSEVMPLAESLWESPIPGTTLKMDNELMQHYLKLFTASSNDL